MKAEVAVRYILANTSGVTALVGGTTPPAPRIDLGRRNQAQGLQAISVEPAGIEPTDQRPDAAGAGQGVSRLDQEFVLVFCYGSTFTLANALSQAVRAALDKAAAGTYLGVVVQSIQFLSEDYFDENTDPATYVMEHRYKVRVIR